VPSLSNRGGGCTIHSGFPPGKTRRSDNLDARNLFIKAINAKPHLAPPPKGPQPAGRLCLLQKAMKSAQGLESTAINSKNTGLLRGFRRHARLSANLPAPLWLQQSPLACTGPTSRAVHGMVPEKCFTDLCRPLSWKSRIVVEYSSTRKCKLSLLLRGGLTPRVLPVFGCAICQRGCPVHPSENLPLY